MLVLIGAKENHGPFGQRIQWFRTDRGAEVGEQVLGPEADPQRAEVCSCGDRGKDAAGRCGVS